MAPIEDVKSHLWTTGTIGYGTAKVDVSSDTRPRPDVMSLLPPFPIRFPHFHSMHHFLNISVRNLAILYVYIKRGKISIKANLRNMRSGPVKYRIT